MPDPIFIPTYGRDRVRTMEYLPKSIHPRVVLVVDTREHGKQLVGTWDCEYLVCPCQGKGVHRVRDWLMRKCAKERIRVCAMLDDDIKLTLAHWENGKKRFRLPRQPEYLVKPFNEVFEKAMDPKIGMVSFSQTFFNNSPSRWVQNKDNASTYFVNVEVAQHSRAKFSMLCMHDIEFMYSTIEAGYELWAHSEVGVTKVGDCSSGGQIAAMGGLSRRGQEQERAAKILAERYPRFCKLRRLTNVQYGANYGTQLSPIKRFAAMWKAVQRGENIRE